MAALMRAQLSSLRFIEAGLVCATAFCLGTEAADDVSCSLIRQGVRLEWTFDPAILIRKFVIHEDGFERAEVPSYERTHDLRVYALGEHLYTVTAVNDDDSLRPVGLCGQTVRCVGVLHETSHLTVRIHWEPSQTDPDPFLPLPPYVVTRDGEEVARTEDLEVNDTVPAPGKYLYQVVNDPGPRRPPTVFIGLCEVEVTGAGLAPPRNVVCAVEEKAEPEALSLLWENGAAYDGVHVLLDGKEITSLPGDATSFRFQGLVPGRNLFSVQGSKGGERSILADCEVRIERSRLYFSTTPDRLDGEPPPRPGKRITCLLDTRRSVEAWSFGIAADLSIVVPADYSIDGTATAALNGGLGPDLLRVEFAFNGVAVTAIVGGGDPPQVLPAGVEIALLHVDFEAGPSAEPGVPYQISYVEGITDPPVTLELRVSGRRAVPEVFAGSVIPREVPFIRADANGDGAHDLSDPVAVLGWLFLGQEKPGCFDAADADATGAIDLTDAVYILLYLFLGGQPPPEPFPLCGEPEQSIGCGGQEACGGVAPAK